MLSLLHTAKELTAVAVCQLFPDTLLCGGVVSEIGFSYTFFFKKNHQLSDGDLRRVEEQIQQLILQNIPIIHREMMRENAAEYFEHLGQGERAIQILEMAWNVVSIFEIDGFVDVCPYPFASRSGEIRLLKLLQIESRGDTLTLTGAVFETKEEAKAFSKQYKMALKKDHRFLLVKQGEGIFLEKESVVFLPKGEKRYMHLLSWWENQIKSFGSTLVRPLPGRVDFRIFCLKFFELQKELGRNNVKNQEFGKIGSRNLIRRGFTEAAKPQQVGQCGWDQIPRGLAQLKIASLNCVGINRVSALFNQEFDFTLGPQRGLLSLPVMTRDWTVTFVHKKGEVMEECISSLQFISKAIKIFPFETSLFLVGSKGDFLKRVLQKGNFSFTEEVSPLFPKGEEVNEARIEVRAKDHYRISWPLGILKVMEGPGFGSMIGFSVFGAIERVIALSVEYGRAID
ncbi:MAG: hypothetical protein KDK55_04940 [Chlamydiia bacterium]|nr:hypothetical protein [Chlamydiia bacterium]